MYHTYLKNVLATSYHFFINPLKLVVYAKNANG